MSTTDPIPGRNMRERRLVAQMADAAIQLADDAFDELAAGGRTDDLPQAEKLLLEVLDRAVKVRFRIEVGVEHIPPDVTLHGCVHWLRVNGHLSRQDFRRIFEAIGAVGRKRRRVRRRIDAQKCVIRWAIGQREAIVETCGAESFDDSGDVHFGVREPEAGVDFPPGCLT